MRRHQHTLSELNLHMINWNPTRFEALFPLARVILEIRNTYGQDAIGFGTAALRYPATTQPTAVAETDTHSPSDNASTLSTETVDNGVDEPLTQG